MKPSVAFKALSDPLRREILFLLRDKDMSAGEICNHFDVADSNISYHLSQLKKANLIYERKHKNYIYYGINISVVEDIIVWCSHLKRGGMKDEKEK